MSYEDFEPIMHCPKCKNKITIEEWQNHHEMVCQEVTE